MPTAPDSTVPTYSPATPTAPGTPAASFTPGSPTAPAEAVGAFSPSNPTAPEAAVSYTPAEPSAPAAVVDYTPAAPSAPAGTVGDFGPANPTSPAASVAPYQGITPNPPAPVQQAIPLQGAALLTQARVEEVITDDEGFRAEIQAARAVLALTAAPVNSTAVVTAGFAPLFDYFSNNREDGFPLETAIVTINESHPNGVSVGFEDFGSANSVYYAEGQWVFNMGGGTASWFSSAQVSHPKDIPRGTWDSVTNPHAWHADGSASGEPIIWDLAYVQAVPLRTVRITGTSATIPLLTNNGGDYIDPATTWVIYRDGTDWVIFDILNNLEAYRVTDSSFFPWMANWAETGLNGYTGDPVLSPAFATAVPCPSLPVSIGDQAVFERVLYECQSAAPMVQWTIKKDVYFWDRLTEWLANTAAKIIRGAVSFPEGISASDLTRGTATTAVGGTGRVSFTSGALLVGNGTGALNTLTLGTGVATAAGNSVNGTGGLVTVAGLAGATLPASFTTVAASGAVTFGSGITGQAFNLGGTSAASGRIGASFRNSTASGFTELLFDNDTSPSGLGAFVFGYGGTTSSNPNEAYFFQRRNAAIIFGTNATTRFTITGAGAAVFTGAVSAASLTSSGITTATGGLKIGTSTVATLPAASSNADVELIVTNATGSAVGSVVAGTGTQRVQVISNGTNWRVKFIIIP